MVGVKEGLQSIGTRVSVSSLIFFSIFLTQRFVYSRCRNKDIVNAKEELKAIYFCFL